MPLYLTEQQVSELLTPADAITAVEACLDRLARGVIDNPARVRVEVPGGVFAVMPCVDHELGYAGLKTYLWLQVGTPFLVVLFSLEHGRLEAVIEADTLGQLRTAAASAVAAKHLARAEARTLGVIGCGRQAASHVAALRTALPSLDRVLVHCRDAARLAAFCREHGCEQAGSGREAGACDVVVTATTAEEPVLHGEWLRDGRARLRGRSQRARRARARRRGASARGVRVHRRALTRAARGGRSDRPGRAGNPRLACGARAAGRRRRPTARPRRARTRSSLFKSNGLAAWDLAAAARVVELAR